MTRDITEEYIEGLFEETRRLLFQMEGTIPDSDGTSLAFCHVCQKICGSGVVFDNEQTAINEFIAELEKEGGNYIFEPYRTMDYTTGIWKLTLDHSSWYLEYNVFLMLSPEPRGRGFYIHHGCIPAIMAIDRNVERIRKLILYVCKDMKKYRQVTEINRITYGPFIENALPEDLRKVIQTSQNAINYKTKCAILKVPYSTGVRTFRIGYASLEKDLEHLQDVLKVKL